MTEIVTAPFAVNIIKGAQDQAWLDRRFLLIAPSDQADAVGPTRAWKMLQLKSCWNNEWKDFSTQLLFTGASTFRRVPMKYPPC